MTTNTATNTVKAFKLQKMDLSELQAEAIKLGVDLKTDDKAKLIDAIISSSVTAPSSATAGILIPLHSRTEEAKNMVLDARNRALSNREAGSEIRLFQKNFKGNFYERTVPGVHMKNETFARFVEHAANPLEGQQDEIDAALEDPESFERPAVVMVTKYQDNVQRNYMMLWLRRKNAVVVQDI